jgi:hypothetical protein
LEEQPLDIVTQDPNAIGAGAPLTFARLHDHISIGTSTLGDPLDDLIQEVCDKINQGLFDLGIAEETDLPEPDDEDFRNWTQMMADTIREVYTGRHPQNLAPDRPDGYPTPDDIGAAYGTLRLFLKFSTEEKIQEPQAPDILGDISREVNRFLDDLRNNLRRFPPPPLPSFDTSFSLSALWDAILNALEWLSDFGEWLGETVFDIVNDLIRIGGTALSEPIKFFLWMLNKWLFSIYRQLRDTLVLAGYAAPFTEELSLQISANFNTSSLWRSMGDLSVGQYPVEEILAERAFVDSNYAPLRRPNTQTDKVEQPPVRLTAPYRPHGDPDTGGVTPTLPGDFLDAPLGPDDMFTTGPEPPAQTNDPRAQHTFASDQREFGGVIANCIRAITLAEEGSQLLSPPPDYNLDGDRGWAWPSWDVEPEPTRNPDGSINVPDPLSPTAQPNSADGIAHVNAVGVSD